MKLSILICTIDQRKEQLQRLLDILNPQVTNDVEILIECDDCKIVLGTKRNMLLDKAKGDYIVFIDDDDKVPDYYVEKILQAIKSKPDVVGINGVITQQGKDPRVFIHSIKYDHWYEDDILYYRCPNHWNPVKRELALQARFPNENYGEDHVYSLALYPYLKTEIVIQEPMYYYLSDITQSEAWKRRCKDLRDRRRKR